MAWKGSGVQFPSAPPGQRVSSPSDGGLQGEASINPVNIPVRGLLVRAGAAAGPRRDCHGLIMSVITAARSILCSSGCGRLNGSRMSPLRRPKELAEAIEGVGTAVLLWSQLGVIRIVTRLAASAPPSATDPSSGRAPPRSRHVSVLHTKAATLKNAAARALDHFIDAGRRCWRDTPSEFRRDHPQPGTAPEHLWEIHPSSHRRLPSIGPLRPDHADPALRTP
jgi:hypothetical protein